MSFGTIRENKNRQVFRCEPYHHMPILKNIFLQISQPFADVPFKGKWLFGSKVKWDTSHFEFLFFVPLSVDLKDASSVFYGHN